MKIAVIAPSPVPFAFGGAERVWLGLTHYYANETKHVCELVKVPARERNFREIVNGYRQFSWLDLTHFDLVISGKYPAWMVPHHNHVVYMLHRLRGLYDTWPADLDTALPGDALLAPLRRLLENPSTCRSQLSEVFGEIDRLLAADPPEHWLGLPAPLIRAVVRKLDSIGLSTDSIRRHVAISHNVRRRADYFPPDADVAVAYVPSDLALAVLKEGEAAPSDAIAGPDGAAPTFFTASRLDHAKRIALIIDAFRRVDAPARLVIAGDGPQLPELTRQAAGDGRIVFTGRLSERELARHYATALAVPFVPYDEDYGLITLEALAAGRPVVTVRDAGGVLEFVEDGVTGLVAEPDPGPLARAFETLLRDPAAALRMGAAGRERVRPITWRSLASELVIPARPHPRRRVVIANSYLLWPVDTGGKRRLWSLAREFARTADVTLVTLGRDDTPAETITFSPHCREVRIPISQAHIAAEWALTKLLDETSVSDISASLYGHLTPALAAELRDRLAGADLAIACHPYLYRFIREAWDGPVWYDAHNVETLLKDAMLPRTPAGRAALAEVAALERDCVRGAERILAVSEEERAVFHDMFGKPQERIVLVPNGTDLPDDPHLDAPRRVALKERLGVRGLLAVYAGSWHAPNVEGAVALVDIARRSPEWTFWFIGKMCVADELRALALPPNVSLLGVVDDAMLRTVFSAADVGVNPVTAGAGTNFKVIDYAAHGALVLTTPVGIRGLGMVDGEHVVVAERAHMPAALAAIAARGIDAHADIVANAFAHVRDRFTWAKILRDVVS
jgi:glycosyltransferase involved in cell wall biosynthesis